MHTSCSSTSVLFPLLYALFAQTAFLPTTVSFDNETLLALPVNNVSGQPLATGLTPIPVTTRPIVLAFIARGQPIPENEVKETLVHAEQAIMGLVRDHPTQRIVNDQFEYHLPNGNVLISIRTNLGEIITWMELRRVLHALYRYMTAGSGTEETHYQALEFEIEAGNQEKPNIGYGLVWYFNPTGSEVQKRATPPLPVSSIDEGTLRLPNLTFARPSSETLRRLPNRTFALLGAKNVPENEIFPIPKTSLNLSFYFFGPSIPVQSVKSTLQGATAKVRSYLNGPSEMAPIDDDGFRWVLPLSREAGTPVAVTVFRYHHQVITWRQLFDVLYGLYAFTTTFGTDLEVTHYQVLGFRVVDHNSRNLGVGTLSYFTSGTGELGKRVDTIDNGIPLQQPNRPNTSSLHQAAVLDSIIYPVINTDITLTFTFLGDTPIPLMEINAALSDAQQKMSHTVGQTPEKSIPDDFKDISTSGLVSTNILAYVGKLITWKELDYILKGVLRFCQDDQAHDRVLVFEIDIKDARRGRVGFGSLLFLQSDRINVEQRALIINETTLQLPTKTLVSQPSLTALDVPISYPIRGTPITLTFIAFDSPIPAIYVNAAFTSALRKIQIHVIHHPDTPIPGNRWNSRSAVSKVWITIVAYNGNRISWRELSWVLAAVLRFMTEAGEHRCRGLGFLIDKMGEAETGYGSVTYMPNDDVLVKMGR